MKNRIQQLFERKPKNILTIYYTAGFPHLHDTLPVLRALQNAGADMVEIGIPFSDPIADGETIQQSNQQALQNGMTLHLLLEQLAEMRKYVHIPVLLMSYLNPILQFGIEKFCQQIAQIGIDGLILPDLPMYEYENFYQTIFEKFNLCHIFLITPQTSQERMHKIDALSSGFIYAVSASTTTGRQSEFSPQQIHYFEKLAKLPLKNPILVGFGIYNRSTFEQVCQYVRGAIVGSAFIKHLAQSTNLEADITAFVQSLKPLNIAIPNLKLNHNLLAN